MRMLDLLLNYEFGNGKCKALCIMYSIRPFIQTCFRIFVFFVPFLSTNMLNSVVARIYGVPSVTSPYPISTARPSIRYPSRQRQKDYTIGRLVIYWRQKCVVLNGMVFNLRESESRLVSSVFVFNRAVQLEDTNSLSGINSIKRACMRYIQGMRPPVLAQIRDKALCRIASKVHSA